MTLPGVCIKCRARVVWNGRYWRRPERGYMGPHVCWPCWAWMPVAQEKCARPEGHKGEHRSAYAIENARYMATGRRAA